MRLSSRIRRVATSTSRMPCNDGYRRRAVDPRGGPERHGHTHFRRHTDDSSWRSACYRFEGERSMATQPAARLDTAPYWIDSTSLPRFPRIERDARVDVVVVGGGITGLTTAYLLTLAGRSVALLERDRCASVDTGHTTAHLTMVLDTRLT